MKKLLSIILAALCTSTAIACRRNEKNEIETYETETETEITFLSIGEEKATKAFDGVVYSYTYSCNEACGKVYIVDLPVGLSKKEKEQIADSIKINEGDFVVIDYRYLSDSDMQIRNSYRAENVSVRKCIIDILLKYEETHPSKWLRTYETMESEWYLHNFAYSLEYDTQSAMHVDFNNNDENPYSLKTANE